MREILHDYPIHTFFWYFESQKDLQHSPLVIWMNGGPGASFMFGLFIENEPHYINHDLALKINNLTWNQNYNVLYIDQSVQTGFNYDVPTKGYLDLEISNIIPDLNGTISGNNYLIHQAFLG